MKQKPGWLTRILTMICGIAAMGLLLTAPVTLKINNLHGMIKSVVTKEIKASDDANAKAAWSLIKTTGADDLLLKQVPRKFSYQASYWSAYELSNQSEQIEDQANQYLISSLTKTGMSRRDAKKLLALLPKSQITEFEDQINSYLHKYQAYFIIAAAAMIISLLLLLLGHGLGIWLLGILDAVLVAILVILTSNLEPVLQTDLYRGIQLTVSSTAYISLLVSLLGILIWHFGKKRVRKHD
ncbi:MAG: hypothetical protein LKG69_04540 [Lactobacillus sp.]|jgi:hypothetical protein|nr:hypothetical protein [Lactobacillus sp.]